MAGKKPPLYIDKDGEKKTLSAEGRDPNGVSSGMNKRVQISDDERFPESSFEPERKKRRRE